MEKTSALRPSRFALSIVFSIILFPRLRLPVEDRLDDDTIPGRVGGLHRTVLSSNTRVLQGQVKGCSRWCGKEPTAELMRDAFRGIAQLFREGYRYKKTGVILTELVPAHQ